MRGNAAMPLTNSPIWWIAARQADLDRQLGVEVAVLLRLRLEQLLLQARGHARLRDVDQQVVHFGLARQLPQHRAEGFLDVLELLLVEVQVHGLGVLGAELLAQRAAPRAAHWASSSFFWFHTRK